MIYGELYANGLRGGGGGGITPHGALNEELWYWFYIPQKSRIFRFF
jgi:hypothetical protein